MLAVRHSRRDSGIGFQLKQVQKERALKQGIRLIEWTFDPLASRNAYFNIEKLGVIVRRYYPEFYGEGGDRLIAEWWLEKPRPDLSGDRRRVSIPADFDAAARIRVRNEFLANFNEDFYVAAFERQGATSDYIFIRGASHADQSD
jgi:predicted GNAT superfamily acetyltransferase